MEGLFKGFKVLDLVRPMQLKAGSLVKEIPLSSGAKKIDGSVFGIVKAAHFWMYWLGTHMGA